VNFDFLDGHSPGPWEWCSEGLRCETHLVMPEAGIRIRDRPNFVTDLALITCAPDLLAEVKRLRKELAAYHQWAGDVSAFVNSNASDEMHHHLERLMVEAGVWTEDEEE